MSEKYNALKEAALGETICNQLEDADQIKVHADGHFEMVFLLKDDLPAAHPEQIRVVYIVDEKCTKVLHEKLSAIYRKTD